MNAAAVDVFADSGSGDTTVWSEWGGFYGSVGGCQRVQEVNARVQSLCFSLCVCVCFFFVCVCQDCGEWRARVAARRPLAAAAAQNTHTTALGSFQPVVILVM